MDYKEKYERALERAKDMLAYKEVRQEDMEYLFPELEESEDEKIRKAIHIYLDWLDGRKEYQPKGKYTIRDMIVWLEKQGEKKPTENAKTLDADKVIAWLVANIWDFEYYVTRFKKDFGL